MAGFHRETKKKEFDFFFKIAQISLPWQQVENPRTFCSFCHGELMPIAKKWLDSIQKQKEEAMFVTDRRTDGQSNVQDESN